MKAVLWLLWRAADSEAAVMISGETGTGKRLLANAVHSRSRRAGGPFVAIKCSDIPPDLLERELFGQAQGAFTGANGARDGALVEASGGTLFLDDVAEMPVGLQVKFVRALQVRRVRPVGGGTEVAFDTRIVSATNRDMETEAERRRFREDFSHRVNVVHIVAPPLRERSHDVFLLADHFLRRASSGRRHMDGLDRTALYLLASYDWPGNVRELRSCIERAVAIAQGNSIGVEDLPERIVSQRKPHGDAEVERRKQTAMLTLAEHRDRYIAHVLHAFGGNKAATARVLEIDPRTLDRKLERITPASANELAAPIHSATFGSISHARTAFARHIRAK